MATLEKLASPERFRSYNRWLQEVGDRIELHSVSADEAVNLERQVRQFVVETVQIDFADIDVAETIASIGF